MVYYPRMKTTTSFFSDQAPLTERHVQAIWYDATLRPDLLRTTDGASVRVVEPGLWNLEAGPDFHAAVLERIDTGERWRGDVEIHLRPADWTVHGHAQDPAYAHVVAHVTWHAGPPPATLPPHCLSICLGDALRTRTDFSPDDIDLAAYPFAHIPATRRPCEIAFAHQPDALVDLLRTAGARRLEAKARRFRALFLRRGDDHAQLFYEEFMAAFGYKYNAAPFRALARRIPWHELPETPDAAQSVLICAAALDIAPQTPWHTANVRPANSPARRLAVAARLFAGTSATLLTDLLACGLGTRDGQRTALRLLRDRTDNRLGAHRAATLLTNVVTPFARAEDHLARIPDWLCPEDLCAPMRIMAFRLLGRDHNPALYAGNGLLMQGLLQIHNEVCLAVHPDCAACRFATSAYAMRDAER